METERREKRNPARPWRTSLYGEATVLAVVLRWILLLGGAAFIYPQYGFRAAAIWILGGVGLYNGVLTVLHWSKKHPPLAFVCFIDLLAITGLLILQAAPTGNGAFAFAFLTLVLVLGYGWKGVALALAGYLAGEYAVLLVGTAPGSVAWISIMRIGSISAGALILGALVDRHEVLRLRLAKASTDDPGNSVYDLQAFARALENLHKLAVRGKWPYSVLVVDISEPGVTRDYKQPGIDERLLTHLAGQARSSLRTTDFVGRVGEDVFAIALPDTLRSGAEHVARRVEQQMRETAEQLQIDVGVSDIQPTRTDSFDKCLHAAFAVMREAKAGPPA
jgi:diguanylate cyclase (GGDEF)-like protein